jgi:aspartate/methionine/tyrosine aminotransferase
MTLSLLSQVSRPDLPSLSSVQSQVDGLVGSFTQQATDWRSLAAMMAGGMAYRLGRIGMVSTGLQGNQILSVGLGLGAEVTTFEMTNRSLTSLTGDPSRNSNLWRWSGQGGIRQGLLSSLITFGSLKGAGRLAQGENVVVQHLLQDTGMVLGHQFSGAIGVLERPTGTLAEQFFHAEVTNLQLGAGTALSHGLTGGRLQALERGLDLSLRATDGDTWVSGSAFAMATVGGGGKNRPVRESWQSPEKGPPRFFMISDGDGSRTVESGDLARFLREVMDRGQREEIDALRRILHSFLEGRSQTSPRLYSERLGTNDPEEWKLAFRSISHDARLHPALEEDANFQAFARDWVTRPHYKDLLEIQLDFDPALKHTQNMRTDLRILQHGLVPRPSLDGFLQFLLKNQVTPHPSEEGLYSQDLVRKGGHPILLRRIQSDNGSTEFVGNWKRAGIRILFDPRGYLRLPIQVSKPYSLDGIPAEASRTLLARPLPVRTVQGATPGNALALQKSETPALWAMRLMEASQNGNGDASLQIAAYLHELLTRSESRKFVIDVMERLVSLTADTKEGKGIVVRRYTIPRADGPVTLLSLPTTFLPEAWSKAFVEGMDTEFRRIPRTVEQLIEVGSGTGYVSIALSKMGAARRILALDKNPHAAVVGAFNAALNGAGNIEFRQSDSLGNVRENERADLIVGCLPQAPSGRSSLSLSLRELADYGQESGSARFEDPFGLGTLARTVEEARYRLKDSESRLWLMVADRVGGMMAENLFVRQGMHPRVLHSVQIHQAQDTDLSPMVRVEENRGFQFLFRSSEGETLSAREALKRQGNGIYHSVHLIEARPYPSILEESLSGLNVETSDLRYTGEAGTERRGLQAALAENLSRQWGLAISSDTVFIGPRRDTLLEGVLRLSLSEGGRWGWVGERPQKGPVGHLLETFGPEVIEDLRGALQRLQKESHDLLVLNLSRHAGDPGPLRELLTQASVQGTRLVFLEDHPAWMNGRGGGLSQALAEVPGTAPSIMILQSLGDRFGLRGLPLAAAVIPDAVLRNDLIRYGEVNYSRTASPIQKIYEIFLRRLNEAPPFPVGSGPFPQISPPLASPSGISTLSQVLEASEVFEAGPKTSHPDPIDMSFGESEWRMPHFEAPLSDFELHRANPQSLDQNAREAAARYLRESRKADFIPEEIVLGAGVQPLILSALRGLKRLHGDKILEVLVPEPSYGIFYPTVLAAGPGIKLQRVPTSEEDRFLVTPKQLLSFKPRRGVEKALLLNLPSNPAGQYYDAETLSDLLKAAKKRGIYLLADEIFHGVNLGATPAPSLTSPSLLDMAGNRMAIFGGLSKEFAMGGLRLGFAASHDPLFLKVLGESITTPADPFALKSAEELFPRWDRILPAHRAYLVPRAEKMESFFRAQGLRFLTPQGGYSLFVNLNPILGGDVGLEGEPVIPENFQDLLMAHAGIKVKSDRWAGVPGYYRFVYSIDRLDEALQRLERFFSSLR